MTTNILNELSNIKNYLQHLTKTVNNLFLSLGEVENNNNDEVRNNNVNENVNVEVNKNVNVNTEVRNNNKVNEKISEIEKNVEENVEESDDEIDINENNVNDFDEVRIAFENLMMEQDALTKHMQTKRQNYYNTLQNTNQNTNQNINININESNVENNELVETQVEKVETQVEKVEKVETQVKNNELVETQVEKVETQVVKPPIINNLYKLSTVKREELLSEIFLKAVDKINKLHPNRPREELEPLYEEEANKILELYL